MHARCTAFEGTRRIAAGTLRTVAAAVKPVVDRGAAAPVLIFDDETGEQVEVDFRGSLEEVTARIPTTEEEPHPEPSAEPARGPGRPRLGVVGREVTLLPRHWDWLSRQPGGASVALRKLVEEARRTQAEADRRRESRDAAYRILSALAGNLPEFEEAMRGFFRGDREGFELRTDAWPQDVRDYARRLAGPVLGGG